MPNIGLKERKKISTLLQFFSSSNSMPYTTSLEVLSCSYWACPSLVRRSPSSHPRGSSRWTWGRGRPHWLPASRLEAGHRTYRYRCDSCVWASDLLAGKRRNWVVSSRIKLHAKPRASSGVAISLKARLTKSALWWSKFDHFKMVVSIKRFVPYDGCWMDSPGEEVGPGGGVSHCPAWSWSLPSWRGRWSRGRIRWSGTGTRGPASAGGTNDCSSGPAGLLVSLSGPGPAIPPCTHHCCRKAFELSGRTAAVLSAVLIEVSRTAPPVTCGRNTISVLVFSVGFDRIAVEIQPSVRNADAAFWGVALSKQKFNGRELHMTPENRYEVFLSLSGGNTFLVWSVSWFTSMFGLTDVLQVERLAAERTIYLQCRVTCLRDCKLCCRQARQRCSTQSEKLSVLQKRCKRNFPLEWSVVV